MQIYTVSLSFHSWDIREADYHVDEILGCFLLVQYAMLVIAFTITAAYSLSLGESNELIQIDGAKLTLRSCSFLISLQGRLNSYRLVILSYCCCTGSGKANKLHSACILDRTHHYT